MDTLDAKNRSRVSFNRVDGAFVCLHDLEESATDVNNITNTADLKTFKQEFKAKAGALTALMVAVKKAVSDIKSFERKRARSDLKVQEKATKKKANLIMKLGATPSDEGP